MDINKLKENLKNNEPEIKRLAAEELISENYFDDEIIGIFVKGLSDNDKGFRDIVYQGLIQLENEQAKEASVHIAALTKSKNIELRNLAGELLINLGSVAQDSLLEYVNDDDRDVRKFVIDILGLISEEKYVLEKIMDRLEDEDPNVILSVIEAAGNIVEKNNEVCDPKLMQIFIDKYVNDEESQAFIIECIGKVNHKAATKFLFDTLENEQDPFLQIACIDSLAINASEVYVVEELIKELNKIDENLKPVILKTILAISQRIEYDFNLPYELRYIAHNSLMDDDEDLRGAGLIALGSVFYKEDVKYLFNLIKHFNPDIAEHILYILLVNSDDETLKTFLQYYSLELSKEDENDSESELFAHIRNAWFDASDERKIFFVRTIIDIAIINNDINIIKALKILSDFDDDFLEAAIEEYSGTLEPDYKNTLDDLIYFTKF